MSNNAEAVGVPMRSSGELRAEDRASLLARAASADVISIAEHLIAKHGDPVLLAGPEVGMLMLQVREPVCSERFHLGEVVVTRAEVAFCGERGWSMRVGRDAVAALAAAVCDAAASSGHGRDEVEELCRQTEVAEADAARTEWSRIAPTSVKFEELD